MDRDAQEDSWLLLPEDTPNSYWNTGIPDMARRTLIKVGSVGPNGMNQQLDRVGVLRVSQLIRFVLRT